MNFESISNTLSEINTISIAFRLLLSIILCGIIGMERGLRNRPAGFMTYILVGMGSTLIMITNQYIATMYENVDPARMAAQVISGIGFLGAGTILTTSKNEIRGLTTAAGIWATSAIGLAIGIGFYMGAILGCGFMIFSLVLLKKIDRNIKTHARMMEVYIEYSDEFSIQNISEYTESKGYELLDIEFGKLKTINKEIGTLTFVINFRHQVNHAQIIEAIKDLKGITYTREIS